MALCTRADAYAVRRSGRRSRDSIRLIVLHSAEAPSAKGVAAYFASSAAAGSAHAVIDDHECLITLPEIFIPWGAPGANKAGWHLELCGYARWTREEWLAHKDMLLRAAKVVARRCRRYGIPVRYVGPWALRLFRSGITTHVDVTKAFRLGTHWDPGPGFPRQWFLERVKEYS